MAYTVIMRILSSHFPVRKENNSVVVVSRVLISIHNILVYVKPKCLRPSKLNPLLKKKRRKGLDAACDKFCAEVNCFYENFREYLKKWMLRLWMALNYIPQYSSEELR